VSGVREVAVGGWGSRFGAASGEPVASRGVCWSGRRKQRVVLRLLRGESLDLLAWETGQPAGRIAGWRDGLLAAGREGLKSRPAAEADRRLTDAQRKVGELQLEVDILHALLEERGSPPSPRRSS
jgi:transposase